MAPWPDQPCPYPGCGQPIRDLLAEMVPSADQAKPEFKALVGQTPGGAITCPYCQRAVEYDMKLTHDELEFLSAWAREDWEPACYGLPAHRLQLAGGASGAGLIVLIKAWAEGAGKKDQDILGAAGNERPRWPWTTGEEFRARRAEARQWRAGRETLGTRPAVEVK